MIASTTTASSSNSLRRFCLWADEPALFLLTGREGSNQPTVWRSSDGGDTWSAASVGGTSSADVHGIAWSASLGLFVAGLSDGRIFTSPDAVSWSNTAHGLTSERLRSVAWAPEINKFVVVGNNSVILSSSNGTSWTTHTHPSGNGKIMYGVAWSPALGMFAAVGGVNEGIRITSEDGETWTLRGTTTGYTPRQIIWAAGLGRFVAATTGSSDTTLSSSDSYLTSQNGVNWSLVPFASGNPWPWFGVVWQDALNVLAITAFVGTEIFGNSIVRYAQGALTSLDVPPDPDEPVVTDAVFSTEGSAQADGWTATLFALSESRFGDAIGGSLAAEWRGSRTQVDIWRPVDESGDIWYPVDPPD
jgi:hypothetical protein